MYSHYICIMLIYTMFSPYPKTPPLEVAASQGKVRIVKAIISWGSPKWSSDWSVWKDNRSSQWSFLHLYIVYVQCVFFVARSEYVCIYHEWTLWMKPRWLFMFAARFLHRWWVATKTQTLSCTNIQNCNFFFHRFWYLSLIPICFTWIFFMTFINITFGVIKFRFPNLYSSVTFVTVLGSKIGPFHLNDLKCFKSPTCSVVLVVASPKYVPGEKNWRNDFCNCIFGSVFWKILFFFANWMLAS